MKTMAIIPARFASTRFPAKMLAELEGIPIVVRTLRQAAKASTVDDVVVATDDERIARVVEKAGFRACRTRGDHPSGTDRIAEAVGTLDADLVVNVQGDEPFIDPGLIDRLVARMREEDRPDIGTACTSIMNIEELRSPSVVKVVRNARGCALYFSRSVIPFARDEDPAALLDRQVYFRHLGIYAYRRAFLTQWETLPPHPLEITEKLEQLRALAHGATLAVIETAQTAPGIDTPEDLEAAHVFLKQHPDFYL
ncbi:MAG: 3-deoxy-manno-octulosonate cytidylyltransferase [Kiritimatiellae bacterium]|jgi:3-deoxy-manno-octulosonate cytidylyltransferase (CMP-KDO synthetase)|nr:3-deoxy-manno-octulosonate cytidylyltransferase [Kiritimatiellia bacterium]